MTEGLGLLLATGASDCERIRDGFVAQPASTLSALAYVAVGIWIVVRFRQRVARVFGLLVVVVGVGSVGYHGWDDGRVEFVHDAAFSGALLFIAGFELVHSRLAGGRFPIERRSVGYWVGTGAFAIGLTVNLLGRTDTPLCAPGSAIQWHAVWHVATAAALGAWAWGALGQKVRDFDQTRRTYGGDAVQSHGADVPAGDAY